MENTAFIALGSNMGNRYDNIVNAINRLKSYPAIQLVNLSSVYETDPVGYEDQDLFLNMVIKVQTNLSAMELLETCLKIELELGRIREIKWGPRTLDLDILTFNQENIESEKLNVPHPRMLERAFVLVPLVEIDQNLRLPGVDKPLNILLNELPDKEGVRLWKRKNGEDVFVPIGS
ncbi:2-amino-4-hydroxy-6-hydroxymethyldihydropteridine diphosphokinase [Bacillus sp. AFS076308]|uniref:2-amino-4-hydroxy-6- hydroxymethyldihydropteridine diphosphokinase n=1 Tax=unclassified Bacillus (in: firmicutes) TaxID=185979 RepID=UPI000BF9938E|nr:MULTISPECIES: 2-amino-4-hydroxy-6-hydroxymethyldihydropteridine diphosphokinase [unclassified Bacillus (in: firmicutes)]PFO02869.1 2-amino-4-hydroxy-6-hydroxymethyldihydropteridine diphosphokinase [Bacillus sp. AFS076308]PGV52673.1 2-amino-4-hydroxy-6-hydroxymethyldihydropteridine diphosphokinase [Bacillus sp. AFS037270]